jgi:hypothetical protein
MLKSISWQEYFYWLLVIGGSYYLFIIAVFYSKDLLLKLKRTSSPPEPAIKPMQAKSGGSMMGSIREAISVDKRRSTATIQSEDIAIDTAINHEAESEDSPIAELMDEFKALCQIMQEGGATQNDYLKNIRTALSRYGHFVGTEYEDQITTAISNGLNSIQNLKVSEADIKQLWPHELNNSINNHK